jgi:hypothetical protein
VSAVLYYRTLKRNAITALDGGLVIDVRTRAWSSKASSRAMRG